MRAFVLANSIALAWALEEGARYADLVLSKAAQAVGVPQLKP